MRSIGYQNHYSQGSESSSYPDTEEQFLDVSKKVLPKLSSSIGRYIGAAVWKNQGDIRDVISIGKLVRKNDGCEEIS
jgi:hypothetical protein